MNSSSSTGEIKFTVKDGKCPSVLADAQSVLVWAADGVVHVQFYATQITSPQQLQTETAEVSPAIQVR